MSSPGSPNTSPTRSTSASFWQHKLLDHCKNSGVRTPTFNIVSDRRGGRTAWSATVNIEGQLLAARYWYDGQYVNNAKEDAAEVALQHMRVIASPTSPAYARVYSSTGNTFYRSN